MVRRIPIESGFAAFGIDPPGALPPDPRGILSQMKKYARDMSTLAARRSPP